VALAALAAARRALPAYSHRFSLQKFTQQQLFACLTLKNFLRTDDRGVVAHLADHRALVEALMLSFPVAPLAGRGHRANRWHCRQFTREPVKWDVSDTGAIDFLLTWRQSC
jgi:hypothetical protein